MNSIFNNSQSINELLSNQSNIDQFFFVITPDNTLPSGRTAVLLKYNGNNNFTYYSPDLNAASGFQLFQIGINQIGPNNAENSEFYKLNIPLGIFAQIQNYGTQLGGKKSKKTLKRKYLQFKKNKTLKKNKN